MIQASAIPTAGTLSATCTVLPYLRRDLHVWTERAPCRWRFSVRSGAGAEAVAEAVAEADMTPR